MFLDFLPYMFLDVLPYTFLHVLPYTFSEIADRNCNYKGVKLPSGCVVPGSRSFHTFGCCFVNWRGGLMRWTISGFLVLLGWAPCQVGTRLVKFPCIVNMQHYVSLWNCVKKSVLMCGSHTQFSWLTCGFHTQLTCSFLCKIYTGFNLVSFEIWRNLD